MMWSSRRGRRRRPVALNFMNMYPPRRLLHLACLLFVEDDIFMCARRPNSYTHT